MKKRAVLIGYILFLSFFSVEVCADIAGDFDGIRGVDFFDFSVFAAAWGSDDSPSANWNQACDISEPNDGVIDELDLIVYSENWMCLPPGPNGMVLVYVDDPGVLGHEGFIGYMSKYETTNGQYCEFLNAALASGDVTTDGNGVWGADGANKGSDFVGDFYFDCNGPGRSNDGTIDGGYAKIYYSGGEFFVEAGFENHPATYVSWYGSMGFCNYYGYRLPTEWEWHAVADYNESYLYGCGETINNSIANYRGSVHPDGTTEVGSFGAYGYGMCDMSGSVFEWTSTLTDVYREIVGGCWYTIVETCTVFYRYRHNPWGTHCDQGFRVCH